jgi:hypothetical protein
MHAELHAPVLQIIRRVISAGRGCERHSKARSGVVEAMRALSMARRSAVKAKTQAINQLRALLISAPAVASASLWKACSGSQSRHTFSSSSNWPFKLQIPH